MKERGITDGLTKNRLAERNAAQEATENLVQERNALAAENARMTSFINAYLDIAIQGGALDGFAVQELALKHGLLRKEEYCAERHRDMVYAADLKDGDDVYFRVENPATDVFLAEVLAQGVERYAAQLKSEAELANETGWDGAAKFLISESEKVLAFAAQLRQEAAQ
ncbi:hypothetical protein QR158_23070 [Salmonella enterica]|nr:hypothetical protein [Salmonella enterica]